MKILFVASEAYPLVKTGGLADVAGALPVALGELGQDVRLLLPGYPEAMDKAQIKGKPLSLGNPQGIGQAWLTPACMPDSGLFVWLIDCPALFDRKGSLYQASDGRDWPDNHLRFALLARVAAMISVGGGFIGWKPDVIHCNDWQTGLTPVYLEQWGAPRTPSIFTIHNIQYQGLFDPGVLGAVSLRHEHFHLEGLEFHGFLSYLKAGLVYADHITTVSPTYAKEICHTDLGCGFQGLLTTGEKGLTGMHNGSDYEIWKPTKDPYIPQPYSETQLGKKKVNKKALQKEFNLPCYEDAPLLSVISRMANQKGLDLILEALPTLARLNAQLIIVGFGNPALEECFKSAAASMPKHLAIFLGYDEPLAHRVQAGADMLLVPSRFEPCGLTQIYALRYGTLPVVRRTGGLVDTVTDISDMDNGTGFMFNDATPSALSAAMERAVSLYRKPKDWRIVQRRAMGRDYDWRRAAESYRNLYTRLVKETA